MSNVIPSPNMNLPVPVPGQDPGPDWANNYTACLSIIDGHNHANGSGVQINPAGININADLPFNSNNAISVRSLRLVPQSAPLNLSTDLNCFYVSGFDAWFNDGHGNQIQLTSGGVVNATSSGIANGTATASFTSGVLIVNANTNTPANIQAGSILLGNNVVNSKYLTLQPPSAMGSNYSVTLPAPNTTGNTVFLTYDTSNNIGTGVSTVGGITTSNIASQSITQALLAPRSSGTTVAAGGVAVSASTGPFNNSGGGLVQVTNASVTITTTGRPVMLMVVPDGSANVATCLSSNSTGAGFGACNWYWYNNSSAISSGAFDLQCSGSVIQYIQTPGTLNHLDVTVNGIPGTYTYQLYNSATTNQNGSLHYCKIIAYEI